MVRIFNMGGDGLIHIQKPQSEPQRTPKDPEKVARENREKEICLNCTQKKCFGSQKCFNEHRRKSKGE